MSNLRPALDAWQRSSGTVVLVLCMSGLAGLCGRLFYIDWAMRPKLLAYGQSLKESTSIIPARRGMILDTRGRVVAATEHRPDVFVDPGRVSDVSALAHALAPPLNLSAGEIEKKIRERAGSRYVVVATNADTITAEAVRALRNPAVGLTDRPVRSYPLGTSMAHVLGWVGRDGVGLEGIELAFDKHLRGQDGKRETIRDTRRRAIRAGNEEPLPPSDGGHVVLTIDAEIQGITERALGKYVEQVEAESGVAIVMSPKDGEVLAMACHPTFDPNDVNAYPVEVRRNRAVTDPVEPGSAFKPIIAAGALEGMHINRTQLFDCGMGSRAFHGRVISDVHAYGMLDLMGVITKSSNVGMGEIAERMGNKALYETVRKFGLGMRTGIELPGEAVGIVRPLKQWGRQSTQSVAIGYEVGVTPLQLITAFTALVNDGVLIRPRVVRKLLSADGVEISSYEGAVEVKRSTSREVAHYLVKEVLANVVENGTGKSAKLPHYRVAGKTGTTKLTTPGQKGYVPGAYMGTFVGTAPVENPEVVVLVMIRRPNARLAYYGGSISAPAAAEILDQTLSYLGVPPAGEWVGGELASSAP